MLIQLQHSEYRGNRVFSKGVETVEADSITIGRSTNQLVQINCRQLQLEHCSITRHNNGQFELSSAGAVSVNQRSTRGRLLKSGDVIRLPGAEITVTIGKKGSNASDAEISLEINHIEQAASQTLSSVKATNLEQTWLRSRRFAWLFIIFIMLGAIALPYIKSFGLPDSWLEAAPEPTQETLLSWEQFIQQSEHVPSHAVWNSGPLADAHQHFAQQCDSCHTAPFEPTNLAACMECHSSTGVHSNKPEPGFQVADDRACNACHVDHNGGGLVRASQQKCVDCHGDINSTSLGMSELPNVFDFDQSHPEFSLPIYRHSEGDWGMTKQPLGSSGSTESSGIRFSHKFHLEKAKQQYLRSDEAMACSDCHQPNHLGGFDDIVMEDQCQSCHSLSFDTDVPLYEAPHQEIEKVVQAIEQWYLRKQQNGQQPSQNRKSLRPGQSVTESSQFDSKQHAQKVASSFIERESCVQCHQISQRSAPLRKRHVEPVFIQPHWLKTGSFDHALHKDQECSSCHSAAESSQSADVLIPSVKVCQTCHIGENIETDLTEQQRSNNCLDCHSYHQAPRVLLGEEQKATD